MNTIWEPERQTPIWGSYDVVVAGGGVAGIAAALAAKRTGAKRVLLIEREYALGGLATLGLVAIYLPLCDGNGTQVSFGIAEELLRLAVSKGCKDPLPTAWLEATPDCGDARRRERFEARYDPNVFSILAEQVLLSEGVELLYGTFVCQVLRAQAGPVTALLLENKSGRGAVEVGSIIDATGDADVCALAGAPTCLFEQKNVLAAWYLGNEDRTLTLHTLGAADVPEKYRNGTEEKPLSVRRFTGLDAKENTQLMCLAHSVLLEDFLKHGPVAFDHSLAEMAHLPQLRMTRRLVGATTLEDTMFTHFPDSIGMIANWRRSGPIYEIPFSALYSPTIPNVIVAGRCISANDAMWDFTRVIPACAVTGQAAGVAAALTQDFCSLNVTSLQKHLDKFGVVRTGNF